MPELPDIEAYLCALDLRIRAKPLQAIRLRSAFLLRSVEPSLDSFLGHEVAQLRRIGKRIVFAFPGERFLVIHLMIAGRFRWAKPGAGIPGRSGLAAFDFPDGSLILTEAGSRKRAWLRALEGAPALEALDPGGIEPLTCTRAQFIEALTRENRTLKRALTDPRILSGIGNAYSDEILHGAGLSPLQRTRNLDENEQARLFEATVETLTRWRANLCAEAERAFPKRVTAFREEMAVHGRYRKPCPTCGSPVQRIVYASNEANYCPSCQTQGRILADRALSRLLKDDWPRRLEDLEPD